MAHYTITSDFGTQSYLPAAVEACIYNADANARITVISNRVQAFNIYQASYLFKSALRYYQHTAHHFVLCGLYNSNHKSLLISKVGQQYVYHVDNGFLPLVSEENLETYELKLGDNFRYNVGDIAAAFTQASVLLEKKIQLSEFANAYTLKEVSKGLQVVVDDNYATVSVLSIDRFHNVILNITEQEFNAIRQNRNFRIEFSGNEAIDAISSGYNDVALGTELAFFNDAGFLEIAVRNGNAAKLFGFEAPSFKDSSLEFDMEDNAIYKSVTIRFY